MYVDNGIAVVEFFAGIALMGIATLATAFIWDIRHRSRRNGSIKKGALVGKTLAFSIVIAVCIVGLILFLNGLNDTDFSNKQSNFHPAATTVAAAFIFNSGHFDKKHACATLVPMAVNVEVVNNGKENSVSLLRRFTKKVQKAGVLPKVRSLRYSTRTLSEYVKKKRALKYIRGKEKIQELVKLGRISEKPELRGGHGGRK